MKKIYYNRNSSAGVSSQQAANASAQQSSNVGAHRIDWTISPSLHCAHGYGGYS